MEEMEDLVTIDQVAEHFKVNPMTIRRWVDAGMPCLTPSSKCLRFYLSECIAWSRKSQAAV